MPKTFKKTPTADDIFISRTQGDNLRRNVRDRFKALNFRVPKPVYSGGGCKLERATLTPLAASLWTRWTSFTKV